MIWNGRECCYIHSYLSVIDGAVHLLFQPNILREKGCKGFTATWKKSKLLFVSNLTINIWLWSDCSRGLCQLIPWVMIWRVFRVKTRVCESNGVAGHLLENPVNSSMKCIEATLFEITLLWNPQYCKGGKKNIVPLAEQREKNKPTPSGSLSLPACLLLLVSSTPFFGIYLEYERIEATPGLTDTVLLY